MMYQPLRENRLPVHALTVGLLLLPVAAVAEDAASDPSWISVVPPLFAIFMALIFRQVLPALFAGIWFGAWAIRGLDLNGLWLGLLDTVDVYVKGAVADADHAAIVIFSMMIGGMVGIISRNGGMHGVVSRIARWATTPRRASISTGFMGLAIFFDDYANTLVVGNTMRPVTDRLKVSREKLAYIVDSTAAPVACIAFITTWIGYEVGLIKDALDKLSITSVDAYSVFLESLAYSFYPILCILFVFLIAWTGKDFGPMLKSEQRANRGKIAPTSTVNAAEDDDGVQPIEGRPQRPVNALLPLATLIISVVAGIMITGGFGEEGKSLRDVIGDGDSYKALVWGSMLSVIVAILMSVVQGVLSLEEAMDAWFRGARSMLFAMLVLILAWSLSAVSDQLGTGTYLATALDGTIAPALIPALVFVLAALTAFATGSSWATMGILMPLVVPLLAQMLGGDVANPIFYSAIACVLAGAVWGDHCSPISDTTVLSSMASGCDHIEHVRTQLPYAMVVGMTALMVGTLPSAFGVPWWLCMLLGAGMLLGILQFAGTDPTSADD